MKNRLPADFLWGNSVSSMQTEGAWNEGGKGMSVYDIRQPAELPPTGRWRPTLIIVIGKISI